MTLSDSSPMLIAVDLGNSRLKLGLFDRGNAVAPQADSSRKFPLPEPTATIVLPILVASGEFDVDRFSAWCEANIPRDARWLLASVHRGAANCLADAVARLAGERSRRWPLRRLDFRGIPLSIDVEEPSRVGIDRLLAALAADRLRGPGRAAIVVDLGTCIKVDLVTAEGAFAGGAILPGIAMSARALDEQTDALPRVALATLDEPPAPLGKHTLAAIESGLYWGAVGAIRELVGRLAAGVTAPPDIFLTGGASPQVAQLLAGDDQRGDAVNSAAAAGWNVRHVPHLVLSGIALAKQAAQPQPDSANQ